MAMHVSLRIPSVSAGNEHHGSAFLIGLDLPAMHGCAFLAWHAHHLVHAMTAE